jgi:hypothetical protein
VVEVVETTVLGRLHLVLAHCSSSR